MARKLKRVRFITNSCSQHLTHYLLRLMSKRLRSESQGADTIVWLAASDKGGKTTGKYFFDRKARWTNLPFANTKAERNDYENLIDFCKRVIGDRHDVSMKEKGS